jgi:hypothetical protein
MIRIGKTKIVLDKDYGRDIEDITASQLPQYLGEPVEIEEGVSFKKIFELCIINRKIFNIVFHSFTRGYDIDMYIEDFLSNPKEEERDIKYLEVYRVFEHHIYDDGENDWSYYYGFHGKGKEDENGITNYGLLGLSLADLKGLPIKVNNELDITIDSGKSFEEAKSFKEKYPSIHKAQIPMTLFNFIGAILFELTFYGTPTHANEFSNKLREQSEAIDRGEVELFEWKKDNDGKHYFEDKDGNKEYIFDKKDDEDR